MLATLEAVITGSACLTIAVGVPSAILALLSVSNADRGNEISINFPGTWEAEAVPYGTSFGDLESIAAAGIFTAVVAACTLCLIRLQPHSVSISPTHVHHLSELTKPKVSRIHCQLLPSSGFCGRCTRGIPLFFHIHIYK